MTLGWLAWWRPPALLKRVTVVLKDSPPTSLQGVLWTARGPWLVLKQTTVSAAGSAPETLDGDIVVHRGNVSFLQVEP